MRMCMQIKELCKFTGGRLEETKRFCRTSPGRRQNQEEKNTWWWSIVALLFCNAKFCIVDLNILTAAFSLSTIGVVEMKFEWYLHSCGFFSPDDYAYLKKMNENGVWTMGYQMFVLSFNKKKSSIVTLSKIFLCHLVEIRDFSRSFF